MVRDRSRSAIATREDASAPGVCLRQDHRRTFEGGEVEGLPGLTKLLRIRVRMRNAAFAYGAAGNLAAGKAAIVSVREPCWLTGS